MPQFSARFAPFAERMQAENLPQIFINTFAHYYEQLLTGATGLISEAEIMPVDELPDVEQFPQSLAAVGERVLGQTAVIKLNGGLGTSMGLEQPKSLLAVKEELSFLDITALQAREAGVPLILMNSFNTEADSRAVLARYPELNRDLPQSFLQHKEPKIRVSDLAPVTWPENPELAWCPPGHGDIYTALITSGVLDALLEQGYQYAFVSNIDNLGAVIDRRILGYFAQNQVPFMMEVADRTEMDKKGGHLAQTVAGQLVLRESAQCPDEEVDAFQDVDRYQYFNTNNLWFHLPTIKRVMGAQDYKLGLPMIRNRKTVDPRDESSTAVYQLETAMGSAIAVFPESQAIRVPRARFAPVKTSNDLLAVRSDAYLLSDDFRVVPFAERQMRRFTVSLDPDYYKFIFDLEARFPYGPPSLKACHRLEIAGDISFGRDVVCRGEVRLQNCRRQQVQIADGAELQGTINFD